ncbi:MAG: transporter substrate-binding domain-containing protein [Oscillospiraceae bacterium]|jgi:ABC-type amino acid transport substrate-binding protein|nr:transporter substrate-binding domain-containing protein [Oscillospiraceae bacterium]
MRLQAKNLCITGLMILLLCSGCGITSPSPLGQSGNTGPLRVAVSLQGEPYSYRSNEEFSGSEVDMARAFAQARGQAAVFVPMERDALAAALSAGEADLAIGRLASADAALDLSLPFSTENIYALSRRDEVYNTLGTFEGKKLASACGVAVRDRLDGLSQSAAPVMVEDIEAAIAVLLEGELDVILCYARQAAPLLETYGDDVRCDQVVNMSPADCGFGVEKGNTAMLEALNTFIEESASQIQ